MFGLAAVPLTLLVCGLALAVVLGLTALAVVGQYRAGPGAGDNAYGPAAPRGDAAFWNAAAGLSVAAIVLAVAIQLSPAAGVVLTVATLIAAAAGAMVLWYRTGVASARETRRLKRRRERLLWDEAVGRHDALLRRWLDYELDAGRQIEHPGMGDVRRPATAAMVRAMRVAARLREAGCGSGAELSAYTVAVEELGVTLYQAELASGVESSGADPESSSEHLRA